jgi:hypothetical protein
MISTKCMVQAPITQVAVSPGTPNLLKAGKGGGFGSESLKELAQSMICPPFALTHCEFKFGRADWSLICSKDSGGSW